MYNIAQGAVAKEMYFAFGQSGLDNVLCSLALSRLKDVNSILDMACGHGRVGRFLRAAFPNARMTFCELDGARPISARILLVGLGFRQSLNSAT
jgi:trans-aconitate methyltransferase